ncbi:MAG: TonB-dependent receptor [Pseudomonadota bacterium]
MPLQSRRAWLAVLATLLTSVATAQPLLRDVLSELSTRLGWNYVLGPGVSLDTPVDQAVTSETALASWLQTQGIELVQLPSGDRELRQLSQASLSLSALPVTATLPVAAGLPLRSGVSATTVSASDIENLTDNRLDQLFARAANVFGSGDEYYFRGIPSAGDLNTLGNAAAVVGEAPLAGVVLANLPLSTWDTASAGFERGPRSASVAGPFSTFGGRISIVPQQPQFTTQRALRAGVSDLGDTQASVMINQPLLAEELALRVSFDRQTVAGTLDDPGDRGLGSDFNFSRSNTARLAALWEPATLPEFALAVDWTAFDGRAGPQRLSAADPFSRRGRAPPFREREVDGHVASLKLSWEPAATQRWDLSLVDSGGDAELEPSRLLVNDFDPTDLLIDAEEENLRFAQLNWEARWRGANINAGLSTGVNQSREVYRREQRRWQLDSRLRRHTASVAVEKPLSTRWRVEAGVRLSRDELRRDCETRPETAAPDGDNATLACLQVSGLLLIPADGQFEPFRETYRNVSPELALSYRPGETGEYFMRLAEGFNAGGAVSDATFAGTPQWLSYEPERIRSAELGWRGQLGPLQLSTTGFFTQLDQQWQVVEDQLNLGAVTNAGKSRNWGLELDGRWRIGEAHALSFSLGWLDTEYEQFLPFERDALLEPASGNQFPGAPRYSGALSWASQLGGGWRLGAGLSFHASVQANANNPEAGEIPGVALTDLNLGWQGKGFQVALTANNLFDRDYHQTTPNVVRRNQRIDFLPGRPRNITLTVHYRF